VLEALQQTYERVVVAVDPAARPDLLVAAAAHATAAVFVTDRGDCAPSIVTAHAAVRAAVRCPLAVAALTAAAEAQSMPLAA
jgi:hypothetical protein